MNATNKLDTQDTAPYCDATSYQHWMARMSIDEFLKRRSCPTTTIDAMAKIKQALELIGEAGPDLPECSVDAINTAFLTLGETVAKWEDR